MLFVGLAAALEGLSSLVLFARGVLPVLGPTPAWTHVRYDDELGWVSIANLYIPNLYGPGMHLRTNGDGFRSVTGTDEVVPSGRRRVICSGDSFTFGYGVGDEHTWCFLLGVADPRVETVNIGQGGYGADQILLAYERFGARVRHDLHLMAFITHDFLRMESETFQGYGKPRLALEHGELAVKNVPVPRAPGYLRWLTPIMPELRSLRGIELSRRIMAGLGQQGSAASHSSQPRPTAMTRQVLAKVLERATRTTTGRSSELVLVYLPTPDDYHGSDSSTAWIDFLEHQTAALGIPFINIVQEHRGLPTEERVGLFGAHRHYSVKGNEYVANVVSAKLQTFPRIAALLSSEQRE
jgi:hypothetical protein